MGLQVINKRVWNHSFGIIGYDGKIHMRNYLEQELYQLIRDEGYIFDFFQESTLDGLWYWDIEKPENEWMNNRFWTTLGYDPEEMPHKSSAWQDIINPEDLKVALDNFSKHLKNPNHPYDQIVRYTHKNGSTVWIRCRGMAVRDKTGKPMRMLGAHHNITEQKYAEQELEELNTTKNKLFSIISHDLRSPFNAILGLTNLLLDNIESYDQAEVKKLVKYINKTGENTLNLLNNLLEWSKLQTGKINFSPQNTDVKPIIENVINQLSLAAQIKNITLNQDCIGDSEVSADPDILTIVLRNLISNSIKFTKPGGQINVTAQCSSKLLKIAVIDNGIGISEKNIQKLFKVDKNLTTNGTENEIGSGLGLILCKEFVELHGGKLSVESELGKGSVFSFTLACMCL